MISPRRLVCVLTFLGASIAGTAHAESPRPTEHLWYGHQTLAVDGASAAVLVVGGAAESGPIVVAGLGGLVLGAPIVHLAQDEKIAALGSLGARLFLPTVGAFVGYNLAGSCNKNRGSESLLGPCFMHGWDEALLGGAIGLSAAVALDAAVFARTERPMRDTADTDARPRITSLAPSYDPKSATTAVGLAGVF